MEKIKHLANEYGTQILIIIAGVSLILLLNNFSINKPHELDHKLAPAFSLNTVNGEKINLADKLGKQVIVLDFFATWCPPCVKGLPTINKLADEYASKGVQFYAVNVMETIEEVKPFLKSRNLSLEVLMDTDHTVSDLYKVEGIPQTVIIGKDGMVHTVHVGVGPGFEDELRTDIEIALSPPGTPN